MRIEVLYVEDCPHYRAVMDRLRTVLREEGLSDGISGIEVKDAPAAKLLKFSGSPTVRINGRDLGGVTETAFACRWYPAGLPSEEAIRDALREAREQ